MANYTKLVNYIVKDALPSGNTAKIIRGTELDNEFSAISSAIASKLDSSGGSLLNGSLSGTTNIGGTLNVSANTTITGVLSAATFSSSNATITGGSVNSTPIGNTTPSTGAFTNLSYSGSLTGGTGVINIGSGQVYKDAAGNVGVGTATPGAKLDVNGRGRFFGDYVSFGDNGYIRTDAPNILRFQPGASGYQFRNASNSDNLAVLDTAGNLGLGVTPSAWGNTNKVIDINTIGALSADTATIRIGNNGYADNAGTFRYKTTAGALLYGQNPAVGHFWSVAPSGTAGATINFTQAMTLDSAGFLGVGETSPTSRIHANGTIQARTGVTGVQIYGDGGSGCVNSVGSFPLIFQVNATERGRFTPGGNLLVGTTSDSGAKVTASIATDGGDAIRADSNASNGLIILRPDGVGGNQIRFGGNGANANILRFVSGGDAERARITSAGYFKASNTGGYGNVAGVGDLSSTSQHVFQSDQNSPIVRSLTGNTGGTVIGYQSLLPLGANGYHFVGNLNGAEVYRVLATGNVQNTNNSYGAISDIKLKENITDATPKLANLNKLRVVNYNLKADESKLKQIGLIAQEVEQVFPSLVESTPDTVEVTKTRTVEVPAVLDEEGNEVTPATTREETYTEREPNGEVTKAVKYSVLVPMLLKAVQELSAEIEALKAKLP